MSSDLPAAGTVLPPATFGPFDAVALVAFAAASGDDNPLHLDAAVAVQAGLARPPIHGMLMVACFEPALAAWRGDLHVAALSVKFIRPVLEGETVVVSGRVIKQVDAGAAILMRLMAHGGSGDLAVLGEATLRPTKSR